MATISGTPRPAYIYDAANNQWVPVGFGPHTHAEYVAVVGGSTITNTVASTKPLVIKGAASQSANLLELQNSSGTALSHFNSSGGLYSPSVALSSYGQVVCQAANTGISISGGTGYPNGGTIVFRGANGGSGGTAENGLEFLAGGTEKMRLDTNGKLTFGTTAYGRINPGTVSYDYVNAGAWLGGAITTTGSYGGPISMLDGTAGWSTRLQNAGASYILGYGTTASGLTDVLQLTNAGKVGIGMSPNTEPYPLQVAGRIRVGSGNQDAEISWRNRNNTNVGWVIGVRDDVGGANNDLKFLRLDDANNYAGIPVQITKADGYLLVGYSSSNGAYRLQVNSQIFATSSTIATSDARYKENVTNLEGGLAAIKALRPVEFNWKAQEDVVVDEKVVREAHSFPEGKTIGFIAQEVQEALADKPWINNLVKENSREVILDADGNEIAPKEDFLGIAEGNLIAVLVSAVKELTAKVEELEAKLA